MLRPSFRLQTLTSLAVLTIRLFPSRISLNHLGSLALAMLLSACANTWPWALLQSPSAAQRLADEQEYAAALALVERRLAAVDEESARATWLLQQQEITADAEAYAAQLAADIDAMVAAGNWPDALSAIAWFDQRVPDAARSSENLRRWREAQTASQQAMAASWLVLRSQQLPEAIALLEKRLQLQPGNRALQKNLQQLREEATQVYRSIEPLFLQAEAAGERDGSLLYARALQRLEYREEIAQVLLRLREQQAVAAEQQETSAQPVAATGAAEREYQSLLSAYGKALVNSQWLEARKHLDRLLVLRPREAELLGQDTHLKEIFAAEVEQARTQGEQLYSAGDIEAALETWRAAQPLAGDDPQLQSNIERAQRILDKVRELTDEAAALEPSPDTVVQGGD